MNVTTLRLAVAAGVTSVAISARSDEPAKVPKAEVQQLITGKTLVVKFPNSLAQWYFADNGSFTTVILDNSSVRGGGTWSLDEEGRICMKSRSMTLDGCRFLMKSDRGFGFTRVDGTGFVQVTEIR